MNKLCLIVLVSLSGCAVIKDAQVEMKKELYGFKSEWNRVILKQEPREYE